MGSCYFELLMLQLQQLNRPECISFYNMKPSVSDLVVGVSKGSLADWTAEVPETTLGR